MPRPSRRQALARSYDLQRRRERAHQHVIDEEVERNHGPAAEDSDDDIPWCRICNGRGCPECVAAATEVL